MRIKLTESQFNRLLLLEANDNLQGMFQGLSDKDIITIVDGGSDMRFEVMKQDGNSIMLRNMNKGSVHTGFSYLLAKNDQVSPDGVLRLFRWKKGGNPNTRKDHTFKNITKVTIIDSSGVSKKDIVITPEKPKESASSDPEQMLESMKDMMEVGVRFFFRLGDGTDIVFNVLSKTDTEVKLKLVGVSGSSKAIYDKLKGQEFVLKLDISSLKYSDDSKKSTDILLFDDSGAKTIIPRVVDSGDYYATIERDDDPDEDEDMSKEEILNVIMSNPTLRDTFYKQPKLMGFINAGEPVGIATANKLLQKFNGSNGKGNEKSEFKELKNGAKVTFNVLEDISFRFEKTDERIKISNRDSMNGTVSRNNGNVYIKSFKGAKRWSVQLKESEDGNIYTVSMQYTIVFGKGYSEKQQHITKIKITDYND
tara:strand:- start:524 stop:1789 length:1266 start_codon:yes stop_codon:yes gene_type:complete